MDQMGKFIELHGNKGKPQEECHGKPSNHLVFVAAVSCELGECAGETTGQKNQRFCQCKRHAEELFSIRSTKGVVM